MTSDLHIVQLVLDGRELVRLAARQHRPGWLDEGYAIHAGLAHAFASSSERAAVPFGTFAVQPDSLEEMSRPRERVRLLGYATESEALLRARLAPGSSMLVRELQAKPMPPLLAGMRADFRLRVCPVVRTKRPGDRPLPMDARGRRRGRELDAFIHATLDKPKEHYVSREAVYVDWLRQRVAAGGAVLDEAKLVEFRRDRIYRERKDREHPPERPNALMEGALTIADADAFRALLARGVGRHRAFGFGMLLLRPARR